MSYKTILLILMTALMITPLAAAEEKYVVIKAVFQNEKATPVGYIEKGPVLEVYFTASHYNAMPPKFYSTEVTIPVKTLPQILKAIYVMGEDAYVRTLNPIVGRIGKDTPGAIYFDGYYIEDFFAEYSPELADNLLLATPIEEPAPTKDSNKILLKDPIKLGKGDYSLSTVGLSFRGRRTVPFTGYPVVQVTRTVVNGYLFVKTIQEVDGILHVTYTDPGIFDPGVRKYIDAFVVKAPVYSVIVHVVKDGREVFVREVPFKLL